MFGWVEVNGIMVRIRDIIALGPIIQTEVTQKFMFYVQGTRERYYSQSYDSKLAASVHWANILDAVSKYEKSFCHNAL